MHRAVRLRRCQGMDGVEAVQAAKSNPGTGSICPDATVTAMAQTAKDMNGK